MQADEFSECVEPLIVRTMSGAVPGPSIAVVAPGGIVWQKGFGVADIATCRPAAPETVYPWFSVTKIATATAIMQLAERGALKLDDPVVRHYPAFDRLRPEARQHSRFRDSASLRLAPMAV
jgi:CubicO group peptidase (beta-lactamase class C family)